MKRIICALLACLLLCACTSAPALKEGWYLAPLEETGGSPMYFCLESGGSGYVHTMGQDTPITWSPEGLEHPFADGVVTEEGIEFPDGLVFPYSAALPGEYTQPILRPGFYIPEEGEFDSLMCYAELRADGTGEFSIMGQTEPIEWEPTKFYFGDLIVCATETGFTVTEGGVDSHFRWVGNTLPEGYLPDPPAPGVYAVSSVGFKGDTTFYSTLTRDNGWLELTENKTGTLVFDGTEYPFVTVGMEAVFDGWSMVLVDMSGQDTGGPAMLVLYATADCPIEADSIAFRLLEGE